MMQHLLNSQKAAAQQASQSRASTRQGVVTSYDPSAYAIKVALQPDNVLTGWIPLKSAWVGNSWGLFCPPSIGDAVEVDFQEDDGGVGSAGLRFFNDYDRPLPCPSGEFWLVHKSGSLLKFHNDGSVELHTAADLNASVAGNANVAVTGNINSSAAQWNHAGPVTVNGNVIINGTEQVTGNITGQGGMSISGGTGATATVVGNLVVTSGNVTADGISLKTHTHNGVQTGIGNTGQPQ
jgi:phage baseplate assembly protein gpV